MKASILDLRRRMTSVLRALARNEHVTLLYRGKKKGMICPITAANRGDKRVVHHPAFGLWRDRSDMKDVKKYLRNLRKRRPDVV